jgi:hypothetical protein
MRSRTSARFRNLFAGLPESTRRSARKSFALFRENPHHPSLQLKRVRPEIYSVRASLSYRALGRRENGDIVWFWIGPHDEYERLIARRI